MPAHSREHYLQNRVPQKLKPLYQWAYDKHAGFDIYIQEGKTAKDRAMIPEWAHGLNAMKFVAADVRKAIREEKKALVAASEAGATSGGKTAAKRQYRDVDEEQFDATESKRYKVEEHHSLSVAMGPVLAPAHLPTPARPVHHHYVQHEYRHHNNVNTNAAALSFVPVAHSQGNEKRRVRGSNQFLDRPTSSYIAQPRVVQYSVPYVARGGPAVAPDVQGGILSQNYDTTFVPIPTNGHSFTANMNSHLARYEQGLVYNVQHHHASTAPQGVHPSAPLNHPSAEQAVGIQVRRGMQNLSFEDAFAQDAISATFGLSTVDFAIGSPSGAMPGPVTPVEHDSPEAYVTSPSSYDVQRQGDNGDVSPPSTRVGSSPTTPSTARTTSHHVFGEEIDITVWPAKRLSFDGKATQGHHSLSLFPSASENHLPNNELHSDFDEEEFDQFMALDGPRPATPLEQQVATATVASLQSVEVKAAPKALEPSAAELAHDKEWEEYASFWDAAESKVEA